VEAIERDAILLRLIKSMGERGGWCGETHVQKSAYFLQELYRVPLGLTFILYKYGPYSFDLSDELVSMQWKAWIELIARPFPYRPSLSVGPLGNRVIERSQPLLQSYVTQIDSVAECFATMKVAELERYATALMVLLEKPGRNSFEMVEVLRRLKPHIEPHDAFGAVTFVEDLRSALSRGKAAC